LLSNFSRGSRFRFARLEGRKTVPVGTPRTDALQAIEMVRIFLTGQNGCKDRSGQKPGKSFM
jgi:hypothetical protein